MRGPLSGLLLKVYNWFKCDLYLSKMHHLCKQLQVPEDFEWYKMMAFRFLMYSGFIVKVWLLFNQKVNPFLLINLCF